MDYQKKNFYIYILSILILVSYFFGFYINEDSAGGGKSDLYEHEWDNIQLFINNNIFDVLDDPGYESSRPPLYLIINKYNIFASTIEGLRISYLLFSLSIPIAFSSVTFTTVGFSVTGRSVGSADGGKIISEFHCEWTAGQKFF